MDASTKNANHATAPKPMLWVTRLGVVGCLSLMGAQQVLAQTTIEIAPPEASAPAAEPAPAPPPVVAPEPEPAPVVVTPAPAPPAAEPAPEPASVAAPTPVDPAPSTIALPEPIESAPGGVPNEIEPASIPTAEASPADFGNVLIDTTDYSVGATANPDTPSVVISERSTGCKFMLQQGQTIPHNACNPSADQVASGGGPRFSSNANAPAFRVGPVSVDSSGVRVAGVPVSGITSAASRAYYNRLARPLVNLQAREPFLFPLSMPSPITSFFGWRFHPVHGDRRFHTGTDLGAPLGTPVLATREGRVQVADFLGGYGLTVILRHEAEAVGQLESRYAHLSQLMVEPGEWVEKGEVVGLVGSTGVSTGPHLHFELRQLSADGWVAISPDQILQTSLSNLVNTLNNPMLALNPTAAVPTAAPKVTTSESLAKSAAFRPAQPNAN
ncbi:MAG: M23 family metallopeptidase [Cyanobacteria bacterium P01_D01_bin.44]